MIVAWRVRGASARRIIIDQRWSTYAQCRRLQSLVNMGADGWDYNRCCRILGRRSVLTRGVMWTTTVVAKDH